MGGFSGYPPVSKSSSTTSTSTSASTQAASGASPAAQGTSATPPPLYKDFTNDAFATSDNAKNSQKDIQQFYSGQYTKDWQDLHSATASGDKGQVQQAETRLAADIAALHNLEKQFYVANGDPAQQASKYNQANFTQEGTTESLLKQAGAADTNSSDYTYQGISNATADAGGIQVTAQLNKDKTFQATVSPQLSSVDGQVQVQSSSGKTGATWTDAANTGNLEAGKSNTATTYYTYADGKAVPK